MTPLAADRAEIARFVTTIYLHADEDSFVSLRTFGHEKGMPPVEIRAVPINGGELDPIIVQATGMANRAARHPKPTVFAPIPCTFKDDRKAELANVHNGVAVFVDIDEADPRKGRERLEGLLGPASAVVASGGVWTDPATGAVEDRVHLYWTLAEPTRTPEEHARLNQACKLASAIVGGDPSMTLVHPLRWPGSWNCKAEPRQARGRYTDAKVHLDDVLDKLEQAATLALEHATDEHEARRLRAALELQDQPRDAAKATEHDPAARDADLETLASAVPNNDEPRSEWIAVGLAFYSAAEGGPAGLNAWEKWSRRSAKANGGTRRQWEHFFKSPPSRTGKGALVERARRVDPTFRLPSWGPEREAQGDGWPEPDMSVIYPHRKPAPELPLEVFGTFWSTWIERAGAAKGAPPDYVAAPLLSVVGGLLALHRRASPWPGWKEPSIIWTGSIGLPSNNKSPGADAVLIDVLRPLEEKLNEDFGTRQRRWKTEAVVAKTLHSQWETAVKAAVKDGKLPPLMPEKAEEPEPPTPVALRINDSTPQKLVRLSAANPFGLVFHRDELAGWLGDMDRYGGNGGDRALWIEAYGGRPYRVDRVGEPKPIETAALAVSLSGGIQPDKLVSLLLAGDDDGMAARLIYVWPEPRAPTRPTNDLDASAAQKALARLLLLDKPEKGPKVLSMTAAAADELQRWRVDVANMEGAATGLFLSWLGKLPGLAVRLSTVFEHLWWCGDRPADPAPVEIGEDAVIAAIGFLEAYVVPMAQRAFGDAGWPQEMRDAAAIGFWLRDQKPVTEEINARKLRQKAAIPGCREAKRYDAALEELEAAGWVCATPGREGGKGGRQSKDWAVNPRVGRAP